MLAPHLKSKVDKLWNHFWTAGITNPLVAIEQITYLLFLKRLEGLDAERVKQGKISIYSPELHADGERCKWSFIKEEPDDVDHLIDAVFPWLREIETIIAKAEPKNDDQADNAQNHELTVVGNRMSDAYFQLDPNKGAILSQAITLIDELFNHVDASNVDDDLMGDIFEYLLSEVSSSGKNGQFRTPRHIIRVLVELLDPQPGERIIDPAAGTGGFLFSAMSHIMKQHTPDDMLKQEWDGTPHRASGVELDDEQYQTVHKGNYYVGLDNDRTMVRIGWMNMILHGIDNPQIHQRDSLGKIKDDDSLKNSVLASESFQYVLANPPFTGTVDKGSLDLAIFPKAGLSGKKAKLALTDKSELLFIWRMLDLLTVGGRCAVIIPEGVLFGSTEAHTRLRRELLSEHTVEAIISLPGGAFQPYTGVKTSIIVFQKDTPKADKASDVLWNHNKPLRTQRVWFYEVQDEAFEPNAKRAERKGQDNDLWDMLEKFKTRLDEQDDETLDYYQPEYRTRRWRLVDDKTLKAFPNDNSVRGEKGKVAAIHELFRKLPEDPEIAVQYVNKEQHKYLHDLYRLSMLHSLRESDIRFNELRNHRSKRLRHLKAAQANFKKVLRALLQAKDQAPLFEEANSLAEPLFRQACKAIEEQLLVELVAEVKASKVKSVDELYKKLLQELLQDIAHKYCKVTAIHGTFKELSENINKEQHKRLHHLYKVSMLHSLQKSGINFNELRNHWSKHLPYLAVQEINFTKWHQPQIAYLTKQIFRQACQTIKEQLPKELDAEIKANKVKSVDKLYEKLLQDIAREYAKLDGYDVMLRSIKAIKHENYLQESKSWWADVRVYARNDDWQSKDGTLQGSHDETGQVRPEYLQTIQLYNEKGKLNEEYLDSDCIEAKGWNLSAGQYKPFNFATIENEQSVAEMIAELEAQEQQIVEGLAKLKAMVGTA